MIFIVNHYKMADISIIHGFLVLFSGFLLILIHSKIRKYIRTIHITLGILASIYGLLTYLITP